MERLSINIALHLYKTTRIASTLNAVQHLKDRARRNFAKNHAGNEMKDRKLNGSSVVSPRLTLKFKRLSTKDLQGQSKNKLRQIATAGHCWRGSSVVS
jgi:hypothetical protein